MTKVQRAMLAKVPEVTEVIARTGSDELGLDPMGLNETDSFCAQAAQRMARGRQGMAGRPDPQAWPICPASRPAIPSPSKCAFPKC
jgi:hypothetical protein